MINNRTNSGTNAHQGKYSATEHRTVPVPAHFVTLDNEGGTLCPFCHLCRDVSTWGVRGGGGGLLPHTTATHPAHPPSPILTSEAQLLVSIDRKGKY